MNYKNARVLSNTLAVFVFIFIFAMMLTKDNDGQSLIFGIIGVILGVVGVVITRRYYRCPHCHRMLPIRSETKVECCPSCGKRLDSGDRL